ncbi:phage tail protein [Escherichia coli]|uniref:phage tail protein n=1 Tax=Escherichia coli TaxID=562 RepID=UPI0012C54CA2|nr:phage tail protein [Escherichia coli]EGI4711665.1 phage tail protein [Escherichia coli]KAA1989192.1 phage tail protein [Escherichia coli]HAK9282892.1 phage tail protein [Escherichia coli]
MATKYYAVLTNVGAAKLANATALGAQVEITQMAVGDGNGVLPTPNPAQTALVHELRRKPLNSLSIDPNNANQIIAEQVIPEDEGGWWIREIGLFDKDGDMIAVANCAETYKPQLQEGSGRVQVVRMILIVSSTAAVTLKIDPSVVLATRQYVDDQIIQVKSYVDQKMAAHVAAADPHKQYAPKESPALTGRPTAPTAEGKDSSTQIANTAFVQAAIAALVGSSPEALDTLNELAAALGNDPNFATTVTNSLAGKMDKSANGSDIENVSVFLQNLGLGDGSGRLINCQVFKSSGKYTPTKGTRFIIVEIVGGGGAGGGCQVGYPNNAACGGGGMSGEYVKARVDNPTVTTVTIGYGGTGASASVGAPGGTTSFGNTIIAKGGLGGNVLAEGTAPGVVGPYGAYIEPGFTGANIIGSGSGYNSPGVRFSGSLAIGGPGGDSILGAGAGAQAIVGEGINANGYGGGGSGACVYGGATQQRAGGSGMAGIAIIWEYA